MAYIVGPAIKTLNLGVCAHMYTPAVCDVVCVCVSRKTLARRSCEAVAKRPYSSCRLISSSTSASGAQQIPQQGRLRVRIMLQHNPQNYSMVADPNLMVGTDPNLVGWWCKKSRCRLRSSRCVSVSKPQSPPPE